MPELPEVETVRRGLAPAMEGARILKADVRRADLRFPFPERFARRLTGRRIVSLARRAKYILADLDDGNVLVMHLGMSGSFRVEDGDAGATPGKFHHERSSLAAHDHVVLDLEGPNGRHRITYNDPRRFGYMTLVAREAILQSPDSRIEARAELGVAGEIVRAAPETNLAEELGRLAAEIPSEATALLDPCEARRSSAGSVSQPAPPLAGDSPEALLPLAPAASGGDDGAGDGCPTR